VVRLRSWCMTHLTLHAGFMCLRALALDRLLEYTWFPFLITLAHLLLLHWTQSLCITTHHLPHLTTWLSWYSNTRKSPRKSVQYLQHCLKASATSATSLLTLFSHFLRSRLTHPTSCPENASPKNALTSSPLTPTSFFGLKKSSYCTTYLESMSLAWPGRKWRKGILAISTSPRLGSPLLNTSHGCTRISPSLQAS
jgi:hypothetical protein